MSLIAATVHVVSSRGTEGEHGLTVSSMSSVSAEPPILSFCIHHESMFSVVIKKHETFCINVLASSQAKISDSFAGRIMHNALTFDDSHWTELPSGQLCLKGSVAYFDCRLLHSIRMGSHDVFFGSIEDIGYSRHELPLIYFDRSYTSVPSMMK